MTARITNWAGNVEFGARRLHRPTSLVALRELVAASPRLRVLGTGHSFNRIADSPGDLVSVAALPAEIDLDRAAGTVGVPAGVRYGELSARLHAAGYALHNLASLPHISVAGACATGTHGSGNDSPGLAAAVTALDLVVGDGSVWTLRRGDADFAGAVVGLGSLGVVTRLTLTVEPTYQVRQYVFDGLPRRALDEHWAEIFGAAYSVSVFTDWSGEDRYQVWLKRRADDVRPAPERHWLGATAADGPRHPVPGLPAVPATEQGGVPGPWHTRLPHFRLDHTPSSGAELQSEYALPRERGAEMLAALDDLRPRLASVTQVAELRTVAADELWLSPSYARDTVTLHFTWVPDATAVTPVRVAVEERLAPLGARAHWGKLSDLDPWPAYERLPEFRELAGRVDPTGTFRNDLVDRWLAVSGQSQSACGTATTAR